MKYLFRPEHLHLARQLFSYHHLWFLPLCLYVLIHSPPYPVKSLLLVSPRTWWVGIKRSPCLSLHELRPLPPLASLDPLQSTYGLRHGLHERQHVLRVLEGRSTPLYACFRPQTPSYLLSLDDPHGKSRTQWPPFPPLVGSLSDYGDESYLVSSRDTFPLDYVKGKVNLGHYLLWIPLWK
jgi:hypothetical protein